MDGLEFVGCQLAGTAWQQFLSIESQKNIVAHDIGYVIQWLCISIYNDHHEQLELCVDFTTGCGGSQGESREKLKLC